MLSFKTLSAYLQSRSLHPTMEEILIWIYRHQWPSDADMVVTRIADPDPNQKTAIHTAGPPHRAVDLRLFNIGAFQAGRIAEAVNREWTYDPTRPALRCCIVHDAGSGNHIHLQVHNRTVRADATVTA